MKLTFFFLGIYIFSIVFFVVGFQMGSGKELDIQGYQIHLLKVAATAYSPSKAQTQGHPRQMASGKYASVKKLWGMHYIAISRDLKEKYGLEYGDSIFLEFELQDLMGETAVGKKVENTVDLFLRNQELARQFGRQERRIIVFSRGE